MQHGIKCRKPKHRLKITVYLDILVEIYRRFRDAHCPISREKRLSASKSYMAQYPRRQ
jgi:hypothetical protein